MYVKVYLGPYNELNLIETTGHNLMFVYITYFEIAKVIRPRLLGYSQT